MKGERRRKRLWKIEFNVRFLNFSLLIAIILNLFVFYVLADIMAKLSGSLILQRDIIILPLILISIASIFLIALLVILHRSLEAIPRIKRTLDRVLAGERSLRITLRKKDILHSFAETLNKILDLVESK